MGYHYVYKVFRKIKIVLCKHNGIQLGAHFIYLNSVTILA